MSAIWTRRNGLVVREENGFFETVTSAYCMEDVPRDVLMLMRAFDTDRVRETRPGHYAPMEPSTPRRTRTPDVVVREVHHHHVHREPTPDPLATLVGLVALGGLRAATRSRHR